MINNYQFPFTTFLNKTNSEQYSASFVYHNSFLNYTHTPPYINTVPSYPISSYITQSFFQNSSHNANLTQLTCITNIHLNSLPQTPEISLNKYAISYFGFFEGQYTSLVSDYLKRHFHSLLFQDQHFLISTYDSFITSFNTIHSNINNMLLHNMQSSSYALIVLFINDICYIANVGNSCCIMSSFGGEMIYQLTETDVDGVTRVISLNKNTTASSYQPDVMAFQLKENDNFIIIANQFLFEYLSNEDIVNCVYKGIRTANGGDDVYREVTKCIWEECLRRTNYKCSEVDVLVIFFEGFVKEYIEVDAGVRKEKAGNVIKTIEMNIMSNLYCEQMYFSIYNREDVLYRESFNKKRYKKGKNVKERGGGYRKIMKNVINETMSKRNKMKKWKGFVNKILCCFGNKKIKGDLYKEDNSSVTPNSSNVEKGSGSSQLELININ